MRKFLQKIGLIKVEKEMTLDEYIISIRPKRRELALTYATVTPEDIERVRKGNRDDDNGPEEAGCLILA